jgi:hypothetical protein
MIAKLCEMEKGIKIYFMLYGITFKKVNKFSRIISLC